MTNIEKYAGLVFRTLFLPPVWATHVKMCWVMLFGWTSKKYLWWCAAAWSHFYRSPGGFCREYLDGTYPWDAIKAYRREL